MSKIYKIKGKEIPEGSYVMIRSSTTKYFGILRHYERRYGCNYTTLDECYSVSGKRISYSKNKQVTYDRLEEVKIINPTRFSLLVPAYKRYDEIQQKIRDLINKISENAC